MTTRFRIVSAAVALVVLFALLALGSPAMRAAAGLVLFGGIAFMFLSGLHRHDYTDGLPEMTLYTVALARSVDDAPARVAGVLNDLHHLGSPIVATIVVEGPADELAGMPSLSFAFGLRSDVRQQGRDAIGAHFNGTGYVVRTVTDDADWPLYRPLFEAWEWMAHDAETRELAARERAEAKAEAKARKREAAREAEAAAATPSDGDGDDDADTPTSDGDAR